MRTGDQERVNELQEQSESRTEYPQETEALADSKGRLALGGVGARPGRRYIVRRHADDELTLIPARMIPEREMIVWERPELAKTILAGIEAANRGEGDDLGSFARFADDGDDAE